MSRQKNWLATCSGWTRSCSYFSFAIKRDRITVFAVIKIADAFLSTTQDTCQLNIAMWQVYQISTLRNGGFLVQLSNTSTHQVELRARSILKSRVWFLIKLHSTQFNYHYKFNDKYKCFLAPYLWYIFIYSFSWSGIRSAPSMSRQLIEALPGSQLSSGYKWRNSLPNNDVPSPVGHGWSRKLRISRDWDWW